MKPLVILTGCLFCSFLHADIYDAIAEVESSTNDYAINIKEDAVGRYQIRPIYIRDVNRIAGTSYTLYDRYNAQKAREIVQIYTTHYADIYRLRTGKPVTDEVIARIHNGGGYRGALKECTKKYWEKVKKALDK
jgi:hypothetical protein